MASRLRHFCHCWAWLPVVWSSYADMALRSPYGLRVCVRATLRRRDSGFGLPTVGDSGCVSNSKGIAFVVSPAMHTTFAGLGFTFSQHFSRIFCLRREWLGYPPPPYSMAAPDEEVDVGAPGETFAQAQRQRLKNSRTARILSSWMIEKAG